MAEIIMKGAPAAKKLSEELKLRCDSLKEKGINPCLAILRMGERQDDLAYERGAVKRCTGIGIEVRNVVLPADADNAELLNKIHELNEDSSVHGILMFRPLPAHIDEAAACAALAPAKDMDGITMGSMAAVYSGTGAGYTPCTAQSVIELLKYYDIPITGKNVAVVGRSLVIGRPVSMLLMRNNATVTICHSKTRNLQEVLKKADIVVAALGHAGAITADCLSEGQVVVDVGINWDEEKQKTVGDVDYDAAQCVVDAISPVPGGVGSLTTSVLASHLIQAAEKI